MPEETIVAAATAPSPALRGIVRLSGPRAFRIAGVGKGAGAINGEFAGFPVAFWRFAAPKSYTREDVVEIHSGGSTAVVAAVVERCLRRGARMAQPGEFTRRAFLNGRLDLAQAEAVAEVIASRDVDEFRAAAELLRGSFSREVRRIESAVLDLCADAEAAIDFVDQDIEIVSPADVARRAAESRSGLAALIASSTARRAGASKPAAFLVGPPNAGKSALFNRLGGSAIVSDVAGTTRDVIGADLGGFMLFDAPGIWDTDGLDAEAVRKAREEAEHADLWLFVVDAADPAPAEPLAEKARGRAAILVLNKVDRSPKPLDVRRLFPIGEAACTSASTGEGVPELRRRLDEWAAGAGRRGSSARFHVSIRQMGLLSEAVQALARAEKAAGDGLGPEFVAQDLRSALMAMGSVTGRQASADLLDRIFERFCLGK